MTDEWYKPIELSVENTLNCHHEGGTILASSRGGFDIDKILAFLQKHRINQLYVIGGDGTHRGAYLISQECIKRGLNIAVVGIPKTIDNDVDLIDRYVTNIIPNINININMNTTTNNPINTNLTSL